MNHFMGLEKGLRPLSVHGYVYSDKITFWIPTINSNYTNKEFLLRFHTIKTCKYETQRYKFNGRLRYRIYACKEEFVATIKSWLSPFVDKSGDINDDIRIVSKHNTFAIEKWVANKCESRALVT